MSANLGLIITVLIGILGGFLSGLVGIGGGILIIPALVFALGMSQHSAQGTTLAMMIPPIGLFAVIAYYQRGFVDVRIAILLCIGFVLGSIFGARLALSVPQDALKRVFGAFLLLISLKMLVGK